jgi:DNA-binding CsgD family transcriptional regulator
MALRGDLPHSPSIADGHTGSVLDPRAALLVEVSSSSGVARVPLRDLVMRIGRAPDNDIVLRDEQSVSRHHAELFADDDAGWRVRDLSSRNGTHLNGVQIDARSDTRVAVGDLVGVGAVTIRLVVAEVADGLTIDDRSAADQHRMLTVLSDREREVLALVASGCTDDQCAKALFISVKTVHSHLDRIRDKTGVRRRAELTRLAVRLGLSTPS